VTAYYNEIDPAAVAVLRELIARDVIAPGDVDDRSIKDVSPDELSGYTQCHFFAGGGLWSVAARLAGWPDERELWTGSCPCQPFSAAGKGRGADDPRHLWPDFHRLIRTRRPPVVMGEQVAGAAGYAWFDGVRSDLAREDYAGRCVDIPASSVDAPHQRNRLYWLAVVGPEGQRRGEGRPEHEFRRGRDATSGADVRLQPNPNSIGIGGTDVEVRRPDERAAAGRDHAELQSDADRTSAWGDGGSLSLAQGEGAGRRQEHRDLGDGSWHAPDGILTDAARIGQQVSTSGRQSAIERAKRPLDIRRNGSWWADAEWIVSPLDGKARRAKPGLPFLVDGLLGRVDLWRIGGNAISPILAAEVIAAFLDAEGASVTSHHQARESGQ
jgi:DNA (cytosine-5)-methyltransferase 1